MLIHRMFQKISSGKSAFLSAIGYPTKDAGADFVRNESYRGVTITLVKLGSNLYRAQARFNNALHEENGRSETEAIGNLKSSIDETFHKSLGDSKTKDGYEFVTKYQGWDIYTFPTATVPFVAYDINKNVVKGLSLEQVTAEINKANAASKTTDDLMTPSQKRKIEELEAAIRSNQMAGHTNRVEELKKELEEEKSKTSVQIDSKSTDAPNYYQAIVEVARRQNNTKATREAIRSQLEPIVAAYNIPFNEEQFNQAFSEFRKAGNPRAAYFKGRDTKSRDGRDHLMERYKGVDIFYDKTEGTYWAAPRGGIGVTGNSVGQVRSKIDTFRSQQNVHDRKPNLHPRWRKSGDKAAIRKIKDCLMGIKKTRDGVLSSKLDELEKKLEEARKKGDLVEIKKAQKEYDNQAALMRENYKMTGSYDVWVEDAKMTKDQNETYSQLKSQLAATERQLAQSQKLGESADVREAEAEIAQLKKQIASLEQAGQTKDSKDIYTKDPLTDKGRKILRAMKKQYGPKTGKEVFFVSKNKGKIAGVDASKTFSQEEAKAVGDKIGVDWTKHSIENFTIGMNVELEHGLKYPKTNITNDDPIMTGKIALVHMNEAPGTGAGDDYYTLLKKHVDPMTKDALTNDPYINNLYDKIIQAKSLIKENVKNGQGYQNQTLNTYIRYWEEQILQKGFPLLKEELFK